MGHPGHQAQLPELQLQGPAGMEVAVEGPQAIVGPRGEAGLWAQGPAKAVVELKPGGRRWVWGQGAAWPRGHRQAPVLGVAPRGGAAEGVTGGAAAAAEAAGRGAVPGSGLQGLGQPRGLQAQHRLGRGVEVAELLVEQLHRLARELGEDVPVDVPAEPGEAVGRGRE